MIIRVLTTSNIFPDGLDYLYPDSFTTLPKPYTRVTIPLGKRTIIGLILQIDIESDVALEKLKPIIRIVDKNPLVSDKTAELIEWLARYYHCTLSQAYKLAIPKRLFQYEENRLVPEIYYTLSTADVNIAKNAYKQQALIDLLKVKETLYHAELSEFNLSTSTLKPLLEKAYILKNYTDRLPPVTTQSSIQPFELTPPQRKACEHIHKHSHQFSSTLLYGVTGSGKTEVYIDAIQPIIKAGNQALILVPEINLTPQTLSRFQKRFNTNVAVVHSQLTDLARLTIWQKAKAGQISVLIATRAGLLFELPKLKVIIIDEEHDASYKQQSYPNYHARDIAIMRAKLLDIPIILGSGTPSIETYHHAVKGKYHLISLNERALSSTPNRTHLINLQNQHTTAGLSQSLIKQVSLVISKNEQALLFINRRGFSHSLMCKSCGWCATCNRCEKPYTLHKNPQHLACHFCDKTSHIFLACPNCDSRDLVDYGYGTEKLEAQLSNIFPDAKIARLDRSSTQKKGTLEKELDRIRNNEVDIIVGTQMIAKGHDFQQVSLVGIINADAGFYSQDFHAMEKTAQLITQVAGRTGRGAKTGDIYIQTYQPDNPLFQFILHNNYHGFLDHTLQTRDILDYPPFTYQAYIYARSPQTELCIHALQTLHNRLINAPTFFKQENILSPVLPAVNPKQAGYYRFMLMITSPNRAKLHQCLKFLQPDITQLQKKIRIYIDVDPIEIK